MPLSRNEKNHRRPEIQAGGQLLWTAFIALVVGFLAVQQAADPGKLTSQRSAPEVLTAGTPLSGAAMVRSWDQIDQFQGAQAQPTMRGPGSLQR